MNTGFGGKRWITMGNRLTGGKDLAQGLIRFWKN
jgi:hypothetical protein